MVKSAEYAGKALMIVASAVPLRELGSVLGGFAGKDTKVSVNLVATFSIALAGSAIVKLLVTLRKMKGLRDDVIRLRERCLQLEKQLVEQGASGRKTP